MKHSAKAAARVAREHARQARAASAQGGTFWAQLPYALMITGLVIGLALMVGSSQSVRTGTLVIAGAVLAGSFTRLVLPDSRAGLLRARRRLVDVGLLAGLGTGLLVAGLILQVPR
jgi:Protein of unknown function (DUF3017)